MAKHGHGQRGIQRLMIAGQCGAGQVQAAAPVAIAEAEADFDVPVVIEQRKLRFCPLRSGLDLGACIGWIGQADEWNPRFCDASLFEGNARDRLRRSAFFRGEQEAFVIDAERCDAAGGDAFGFQNIGRIEASAQADFHDAGIGGDAGEFGECCGDRDFEKAGAEIFACIEHFGEQFGQPVVIDQRSCEADAFVVPHKVRARSNMDRISLFLEHCAQEGAGRPLAVGSGDMEDGRQAVVRIAEPVQERAYRIEAKPAFGNGQRGQPVELSLHCRTVGAGEVPHAVPQAALAGVR